jgi:amino acid transporter/mannitol/fructose-specific phosphotransferase system IIA component (Ntr-type)
MLERSAQNCEAPLSSQPLKKKLYLKDVFCLATGAMISSGLFVLPGIVFEQTGPATLLVYALACLLIVPAMLVQAELATAMPKAGGTYVFIERSMGPLAGTFAGFLNWSSIALKAAFALIGLAAIAQQFFPHLSTLQLKLIAVSACVVFTIVNLVSVKGVGKLQGLLVVALLGILIYLIGSGTSHVEGQRLFPFFTSDIHTVIAMSGLVFISFGGLTKIAGVAEEVVEPSKNIPFGMFLAWAVVSLLYLLVVFVTIGTVEPDQLSGSLVPVGLSARSVLGPAGMVLIDLAAGLAFITTANAGLLSASRTPLAMSRDKLLPPGLSATSRRFGTPHTSIFLTSLSICSVILLLSIENLVKTASTIMILLFLFLNLALIVLRLSGIQSYKPPFKAPFFPYLPILSSLAYCFLIIEMGFVPLVITTLLGFFCGIWFLFYVRPRIVRKSALGNLLKGLTSESVERIPLEDELREMSLERASPESQELFSRFQSCRVMDIEEPVEASELYRRLSCLLAKDTGLGADEIFKAFLRREHDSSTMLYPEVAIPMVATESPGLDEVVLIRTLSGVRFSDSEPPIKAFLVFFGSNDQRNFRHRALMQIAPLVTAPDFMQRWLQAMGEDQLRDVLLV